MRDIQSDRGAFGHLTLAQVGTVRVLKLHAPGDDSQRVPMIPMLFDAVVVAMQGDRILWLGFERSGNQEDDKGPTLMQEWSVQLLGERQGRAMQQGEGHR